MVIYAGARTANKLGEVSLVNTATGAIESRHSTLFHGSFFLGAARLSPDKKRLYLARSDQQANRYNIQCLDVVSGHEIWQTEVLQDAGLTALAISPDGRMLVSGAGYVEHTIRVWDTATGRLVRELDGHTGWVSKLVFSKDGRQLMSSATDQTIRFWDTATWTEAKVLRGHTDEIHSAALSEPAQLVASAGKDCNLMLWKVDEHDAAGGTSRLPEGLGRREVLPLDRSRVLLLPKDKPPELADLRRDSPPAPLTEIVASENVLGWFGTNLLCHWNGTDRIVVRELRGREFVERGAIAVESGVRPDSVACAVTRQVLAWSERAIPNSVFVANFATPDRRVELKGDVPGLVPRLFSDDGNYLVAWNSAKNSVRAWNVETGQIVASMESPIQNPIRDAMLSAGGRVLVVLQSAEHDHEVLFYDLAHPGGQPRRVPGRDIPRGGSVSPDGSLVACTTEAGVVRLLDPLKGELIENLHGHMNGTFGVAFSPNGQRLISTSHGREAVKLWDLGTRQELLNLNYAGHFYEACWTADGDAILAGTPWQVWRAPSWEEIAAAEAKEQADSKLQ